MIDQVGSKTPPSSLIARAKKSAGLLAWAQGEFTTAEDHLRQAQTIWEELDEEKSEIGQAEVLHCLAMIATDDKRSSEALKYCEAALTHCNKMSSRSSEDKLFNNRVKLIRANVLISLGILVEDDTSRIEKAQRYLEEGFILADNLGERRSASIAVNNLAYIARMKNKWGDSGKYYAEALKIRLDMEDRLGVAWSLEGVARLAVDHKSMEMAARLFGAAKTVRDDIGAKIPPYKEEEYHTAHLDIEKILGPSVYRDEINTGNSLDDEQAVSMAIEFCESLGA